MVPQSFFQLKKDQCSINLLPATPFFIRLLGQNGEPCIKKGIYYCKPSRSVLSGERWSIIFSFKNMRQFIKFTTSEPVSPPQPRGNLFCFERGTFFLTNSTAEMLREGPGTHFYLHLCPNLRGRQGMISVLDLIDISWRLFWWSGTICLQRQSLRNAGKTQQSN